MQLRADFFILCVAVLMSVSSCKNAPSSELRIFAASSLADVFAELGQDFEATHPGTRILLNFAGSQTLRAQIENGAQADIFAAADGVAIKADDSREKNAERRFFARN